MIANEKLKPFFKQEVPNLPYWIDDKDDLPFQLFSLFYLFDVDYPNCQIKEEIWKEWCLRYESSLLETIRISDINSP